MEEKARVNGFVNKSLNAWVKLWTAATIAWVLWVVLGSTFISPGSVLENTWAIIAWYWVVTALASAGIKKVLDTKM